MYTNLASNKTHDKQLLTKFSYGKHARITTPEQHTVSSDHRQTYLRNRERDEKNTSAARVTNHNRIGSEEKNSARFPVKAE